MSNSNSNNFVFGETLEPDIDFSASLNAISDNDLFKYFLNEDFVETADQILSSPSSGIDTASNSSDSPQPSPPQLSPERDLGAPLVSIPSVPAFSNAPGIQMKIKEEVTDNIRSSPSTSDEPKARSKKRSAPVSKESDMLSREELLKISSKGITTEGVRQASPEAEKQLKRQKRLIKNRESAQLSRLRKKLYIEELERKVTHLTADTETLSKQVNALNSDKKRLQEEVIYLQNIIKQSPELSAALATRKTGFQPKNVKAAGVCLLIILFSVGLIFNQSKSSLPFIRSAREEIPEVIPKSALYTGRVLKSVPEVNDPIHSPIEKSRDSPIIVEVTESDSENEDSEPEQTALAPLKIKEISSKERKHKRDSSDSEEEDEKRIVISKPQGKQIEASKKKRMKISEEETTTTVEDVTKAGLVPAATVPDKQNAEIVPRINPNANYFYCPEAHYVSPASASADGPEIVALLLPASVLNNSLRSEHPNLDSSLLEVSCQVLNLHLWPLNSAQNSTVPQR